ncbi:MAG: transposase [Patescibacteria group bacterium]|nr:transposase [Patescibacteria group bacterium]
MTLYKNIYRVKSTRHPDWDYADDGMYFVTICTNNRQEFFGKIINEKMFLNGIGKISNRIWQEITKHFDDVILDEYMVMPNHIHGIIFICNNGRDAINRVSTINRTIPHENDINRVSTGGITGKYNPMGKKSLGEIIRWYKGRCSFEIKKLSFNINFAWQSRFYDHIIRNEYSLNNIRNYIYNNPVKWVINRNNPGNFLV